MQRRSCKMQHWQDSEVIELLLIRGEDTIRKQISGTVRDTAIYNNISKLLSERGILRNPRQVINKLKALKKKYLAINEQKKNRNGIGRVDWPFYELCQNIFGNSALANPVKITNVNVSSSAAFSSSSCSPNSDAEEDYEIERNTEGEARAEATQGLEADEGTEGLIEAVPADEGGPETTRTQPLQSSESRKRKASNQATRELLECMREMRQKDMDEERELRREELKREMEMREREMESFASVFRDLTSALLAKK